MSFAAVICASRPANDPGGAKRASLRFAGHSLVEYQARQAAQAGAEKVLILVGAVTQELSRAIDRLAADGIPVTLVRDMVTLVREAPRNRDMLLIADGAIIAQRHLDAMASALGNALLVADDSRATAGFERIDAGQRWTGLLRADPDILFGTLDMLGDWDLELTLVRALVQADAARITVPQEDVLEGRIALIDSQQSADLVAQALLGGSDGGRMEQGGAEHYLLSRLAMRIAPLLLRAQMPASQVRVGAVVMAAIALLPVLLGWPVVGLILMLGALVLSLTADQLERLARRSGQEGLVALIPALVVLAGIAAMGSEAGTPMLGLHLALALGIVLLGTHRKRLGTVQPWTVFTPGSAVALLLVTSIAATASTGLAVAMTAVLLSLGWAILRGKPL